MRRRVARLLPGHPISVGLSQRERAPFEVDCYGCNVTCRWLLTRLELQGDCSREVLGAAAQEEEEASRDAQVIPY